jgi:hypothetical protein
VVHLIYMQPIYENRVIRKYKSAFDFINLIVYKAITYRVQMKFDVKEFVLIFKAREMFH